MKRHCLILLILFITGVSMPAQAQPELTFATVDNFPPYTWRQDGQIVGIDVDIIRTLSRRSGIPINIELLPARRVTQLTKIGEIDGGFAAFKTDERDAFSYFVEPPLHYSTYLIFVRKGEEFLFNDLNDLSGKVIGKNKGFHISEKFSRARDEGVFDVVDVDKMNQNIKMLEIGRLDAFVGNEQEVGYLLKQLRLSDKIVSLPMPLLTPRAAHLMISDASDFEDKDETIRSISHTLQEMKNDGTIDAIYQKYVK